MYTPPVENHDQCTLYHIWGLIATPDVECTAVARTGSGHGKPYPEKSLQGRPVRPGGVNRLTCPLPFSPTVRRAARPVPLLRSGPVTPVRISRRPGGCAAPHGGMALITARLSCGMHGNQWLSFVRAGRLIRVRDFALSTDRATDSWQRGSTGVRGVFS